MKSVPFFILISLITLGCTFTQEETIILKTLNQFETQEENEQLGIDLLNYKYQAFLPSEFPDLSDDVFKNIRWEYFIKESDNEMSFRLNLSNEALKHKDRIKEYFERTVNEQVGKQYLDKEIFEKAIDQTLKTFKKMDSGDQDYFWKNASPVITEKETKAEFFESIKGRKRLATKGGEREFLYKQYYDSLPGNDEKGFYVICFTFANEKRMLEQLTYRYKNDQLQIVGYDYRAPK